MPRGNIGQNDDGYRATGKLGAMECFDRLPRELREAMRYADNNWAAAQAYSVLRKPKAKRPAQAKDTAALIAFIREEDKAKRREDWNIPDPKNLPPDEFRKVRDLIEGRVKALLQGLLNHITS